MNRYLIGLHMILLGTLNAQVNLIPDSDFDSFDYRTTWFYSQKDFNEHSYTWKSPIGTSPDLYGPGLEIPEDWSKNGFGEEALHESNHVVGVTLYGCNKGKPHCREYLMAELLEPIRSDCRYVIEMKISPLRQATQIDHLDIGILDSALYISDTDRLEMLADHSIALPKMKSGDWTTIRDTLGDLAAGGRFILLGNLQSDSKTKRLRTRRRMPFAYYYLDKVCLWKLEPPSREGFMSSTNYESWLPLELGKRIILDRVYFDYDRDEITEIARTELQKLVKLMQDHERVKIKLYGHTDDRGNTKYNQELSIRRARAVAYYLIQAGIDESRIDFRGIGEQEPRAANNSSEGRAQNRRVEFEILSY